MRSALEAFDGRAQHRPEAPVGRPDIEAARGERILQPADVAAVGERVGSEERIDGGGKRKRIDAGVGDVIRLEAVQHFAVEHDDLRLHVGADIDADDLGAIRAVDEQRRAG